MWRLTSITEIIENSKQKKKQCNLKNLSEILIIYIKTETKENQEKIDITTVVDFKMIVKLTKTHSFYITARNRITMPQTHKHKIKHKYLHEHL